MTAANVTAIKIADRILDEDYGLTRGQDVEVELLVVGQPSQVGPRLIEGTIAHATPVVLALLADPGGRLVRIPWHAIASIRDAITAHPAT